MKRIGMVLTVVTVVALGAATAQAAPVGIGGSGAWGSYTGSLDYDGSGLLTVSLTNTSAPANGGFITGFLFNVDGNASAALSPSPTHSFLNTGSEDGAPYGTFEAGAALGGNFLGGGNPNAGIGVGVTKSFAFAVTGPDAGSLTTADFLSQTSSGNENNIASFLVRFRGFENEKSDKVPSNGTVVPLPAAVWPGLALLGALGFRRRRAQA